MMEGKNHETRSSNPFRADGAIGFVQKALDIIVERALKQGCDEETKVVEFKHPHELKSMLDLQLSPTPNSHDKLLDDIEKIIHYSVKTGHPHFYNQLYAGMDPYSQVGAWLTEAINTNIHTFEVAPVQILIEQHIMTKLCGIVGFGQGDGIFMPGGSAANQFAMNVARYQKCPEFKNEGMYGLKRNRLYTSQDGHYSVKKGAVYLGFGSDNVVFVNTDQEGRMDAKDLEKKIMDDLSKGYVPLLVNATSGTTVLGVYDNLVDISRACQKYNIWLHCDACWGGGALLTSKYKNLMEGAELCDSIAWSFHKLSGVPLQCSAFLIKHKGMMEEACKQHAEYLFQPDKFYDVDYDIGDKTIQCGRKPDALKLWMLWRAIGDEGMTARVDKSFDNARYLANKLSKTNGFKLVTEKVWCTNVCFWYIPQRLRGLPESEDWWQEMKHIAPKIKERMIMAGSMMIGYQPMTSRGLVNFFRIVINNPNNSHADMDFVMSEIDRLGNDL